MKLISKLLLPSILLIALSKVTHSELQDINYGLEGVITQEHWDRETKADAEPPQLMVDSMEVTLTGKIMMSFYNRTLYAFQGLRYAAEKPERFKPPKEITYPYYEDNVYVANHLPPKCSQHGIFAPLVPAGQEDCLYLNVYIPLMPNGKTKEFDQYLPVMIFYHGGAFIWGDSSLYLPTRLLDEDVILVVPHYRLGSFGFFTTMDERAPGNTALYDQRMAMIWVQNHIKGFGGDPDKVTIFGQSAGSASVNYHLIMPESGGLFRGVIGESGSAIEHWSLDEDPIASAMAVGEINGCDTTDIDTVYECMIGLDEGVITLGINALSLQDRQNGLMGFRGAAPVIQNASMDLSEYGTTPLVTQPPQDYYMNGEINNVSLMIGANKQEGSFILGITLVSYLIPNEYTNNGTYLQEQLIPDILNSFGITDKTHSLAESLAEYYLRRADRSDFNSSTPGLIDMSGMLFLKAGTLETAKMHSIYKKSGTNTFLYAFEYESDDSMFDWLFIGHVSEIPFDGGVTHSDELLYLFSWPGIMEGHQIVVKDRMVKLWTNFAKYLDPTPDSNKTWSNLGIVKWKPFDVKEENYMLMEDDFTLQQQYQQRWTVTNDEYLDDGGMNKGQFEKEISDIKDQKDTFMATMIVFIVLFVLASAAAGFFFFQWKY